MTAAQSYRDLSLCSGFGEHVSTWVCDALGRCLMQGSFNSREEERLQRLKVMVRVLSALSVRLGRSLKGMLSPASGFD